MHEYKARDLMKLGENISFTENWVDGEELTHTHNFIEIVYITSGTAKHIINNECFDVERGDTLFINFGQTHSFCTSGEMTYINCLLVPEFMGKELISSENALDILALANFADFGGQIESPTPKVSFCGSNMLEVEDILLRMIKEFKEKEIGYQSVLKGYITVLLAKIFREMRNRDTSGVMHHVMKISPDIISYIEENCCEKISLVELAEKSFYNPSYFSKVFKECFGKSLMDFIHEKRTLEAVKLLKETKLSVEDICYQIGYSDKKQFYKIFKQYMGVTPRNIRLSMKK